MVVVQNSVFLGKPSFPKIIYFSQSFANPVNIRQTFAKLSPKNYNLLTGKTLATPYFQHRGHGRAKSLQGPFEQLPSLDRHPGKERRVQTQEILRNEPGSTAPVFVRAAPSAVASEVPWLRPRCFDHDKLLPIPTQGVTLGLCRCKTLYLITLRQTRTRVNSYVMEYSNSSIPAACVIPKRHEWECTVLVSITDSNHGSAAHSSFRLLLLVGYMTILHQGSSKHACDFILTFLWFLMAEPCEQLDVYQKLCSKGSSCLISSLCGVTLWALLTFFDSTDCCEICEPPGGSG